MKKYRKKPLIINAIKYTGKNIEEILSYIKMSEISTDFTSDDLLIKTLEGEMRARPGDYIIKGIAGEFYPCKPDIFESTYELI